MRWVLALLGEKVVLVFRYGGCSVTSGWTLATFLIRNGRTSIIFRGIDASKTAGSSKTNVAASGIALKPLISHTRRYQDDPEVLAAIERL
jgi:hypothetical protein